MTILNGTTFRVRRGTITTVIGPNGAGKSTMFKTVFGLLHARSGRITFDGADATNAGPRRLLERGMTYLPQGRNIFPELSVRHNLSRGFCVRLLSRNLARRRLSHSLDERLLSCNLSRGFCVRPLSSNLGRRRLSHSLDERLLSCNLSRGIPNRDLLGHHFGRGRRGLMQAGRF